MMQVCIDARSISHPQRGGFRSYIEGLVGAWTALPGEDEFFLIYDRPHRFAPVAGQPRFHEVTVHARVELIGQAFREQIALPLWGRRHARTTDTIWHFPYNTAPAVGITGYALTLHDMTPFTHSIRSDWADAKRALRDRALYYYPKLLTRRSVDRADVIITVSSYARDRIVEILGVDQSKVRVTPLAAAPIYRPLACTEKLKAREALARKYSIRQPFVLSMGTTLLKNPQSTLRAYALLPQQLKRELELVLVMAHGGTREFLARLAQELGIDEQVKMLVDVAPADLVNLYNSARVLVYPSFTESFPLPTAEAMACGTPIICSNTTGFPEQVGEAAVMVPPADVGQLQDAMRTVVCSPSLQTKLGEEGLRRSASMSWRDTAQKTLNIFREFV